MRKIASLLFICMCFASMARARTGQIVLSVTSTPTTITVKQNCNYVVIQENSSAPSNAFTITLPGQSTGISYPAGTKFVFTARPSGYVNGQNLGTIAIASGTVQFIGIESLQIPTMPSSGKTSGSSPAGPPSAVQYNNSGVIAGSASATTDGTNLNIAGSVGITGPSSIGGIVGTSESAYNIKGPDPRYDIAVWGARPGTIYTASASCTNGSHVINFGSSPPFIVGDGVTIYACGPNATGSVASAPTVTSGQSSGYTVADIPLISTTGSSTYSYRLVSRDQHGGLSAASPVATITTGPSSLGEQQFTVARESLTGNTLTVTTAAAHSLKVGTAIHVAYSSNAALSCWCTVTSVTSSTTFVVADLSIIAPGSSTITSTGGTVTYWVGNQLTWSPDNDPWEMLICAKRPGDSSYKLIGRSFPNSANELSGIVYTDWGSAVSAWPGGNPTETNSVCAAATSTPEYVSGTVTAVGSNSITLSNAASNSASGQYAYVDAGVAIRAAGAVAIANGGGVISIPATVGAQWFEVYSFVNLGAYNNISIVQDGPVLWNETIYAPIKWVGHDAASSALSFQNNTAPQNLCEWAYPCVYANPIGGVVMDTLGFSAQGSINGLLILQDNGNQGGYFNNLVLMTGNNGSSDYSGICLMMRAGAFNFNINNMTCVSGPGQAGTGSTDISWSPSVFFDVRGVPVGSVGANMSNTSLSGRGMYQAFYLGNGEVVSPNSVYCQGCMMPLMAWQNIGYENFSGGIGISGTDDSSPEPIAVVFGINPHGVGFYPSLNVGGYIAAEGAGGTAPIYQGYYALSTNAANGAIGSRSPYPTYVHSSAAAIPAPTYTVSTLPPASSVPYATAIVTDAKTFTPGTCTGGGSDTMIAVSNGTGWTCH